MEPLLHAYPRIRPTIEVSKPLAATPHSWKGLPMSNATTFVGLDAHARSVKACAFVPETGETIKESLGGMSPLQYRRSLNLAGVGRVNWTFF